MSGGTVDMLVNGERITVANAITVAAALLNANRSMFRSSVGGESRGPVCGMGICYECRVTIDGIAHQRACMRVVAHGMEIQTADTNV